MSKPSPLLDRLHTILDDMQANDITTLDVHKLTTVTDFMIICSGRSSRHVKAIAAQIMQDMKQADISALNSTGMDTGDWALIDFGDVIVHVMQPATRDFYNLEDLWRDDTV